MDNLAQRIWKEYNKNRLLFIFGLKRNVFEKIVSFLRGIPENGTEFQKLQNNCKRREWR